MRLRRRVGVAQVSLDREIFTKAMQYEIVHLGCLTEAPESFATGERNRAATGQNLGCVIEKNFVHHARGQRSPFAHRSAFNEQAGDLQFTQGSRDLGEVRTAVIGIGAERDLLYADAAVLEGAALFLFRKRAEDQYVLLNGFDQG